MHIIGRILILRNCPFTADPYCRNLIEYGALVTGHCSIVLGQTIRTEAKTHEGEVEQRTDRTDLR